MVETRTRERHGMFGTPEYMAWQHMKDRCSNPNYDKSKNYMGRGITVSSDWLDSFICFYEDLGERPSKEHSLDRIDNDGNYEVGNCRWATKSEQMLNRRPMPNPTGEKYIHQNGKGFALKINKVYLGMFKTIAQAIIMRDQYLEERG